MHGMKSMPAINSGLIINRISSWKENYLLDILFEHIHSKDQTKGANLENKTKKNWKKVPNLNTSNEQQIWSEKNPTIFDFAWYLKEKDWTDKEMKPINLYNLWFD